jgi:hypothetical protein
MLKTGATVDGTGSHCHTITNVLERYILEAETLVCQS